MPWHGAITVGSTVARAAALHATLEAMAKLDVTLDASGDVPELPEEARLPLRNIIDDMSGYLEQTWELMTREAERYVHV